MSSGGKNNTLFQARGRPVLAGGRFSILSYLRLSSLMSLLALSHLDLLLTSLLSRVHLFYLSSSLVSSLSSLSLSSLFYLSELLFPISYTSLSWQTGVGKWGERVSLCKDKDDEKDERQRQRQRQRQKTITQRQTHKDLGQVRN